jgi:DNA (cytosine-5)-methyltransferase 1
VPLAGRSRYADTDGVKRLFSFPPGFVIAGTADAQLRQLGNSVPPLLMQVIAGRLGAALFRREELGERAETYAETLEAAWQQHLAPREQGAPTVVSLFAGCGGSSLGYSMAGYRELLAVEWDDNAVATFRLNFPDVPVYHGDIHDLSVDECLRLAGLQPGELDVLDGSPPCQGFSTAGKRRMDDERNELYMEYVRLLRGLRPRAFVMENVSGLVKGKMRLVFADIMRELKASGYRVSCRLLNAMWFGVPQSRQRLIWIGVRDDIGREPSHPRAEKISVTVGEALEGIEPSAWHGLKPLYSRYWKGTRPGEALGKSFADWKADPAKPCQTLRKKGGILRWDAERWLSRAEYAILASYPPAFQFTGDESEGTARIGNSVPPLFMRAIAEHVKLRILINGQ